MTDDRPRHITDDRFKIEQRWFVAWWRISDGEGAQPTRERFVLFDGALERVLELVDDPDVGWLRVYHDRERDTRVRWEKVRGWRHVTPYARQYLGARLPRPSEQEDA